MGLLDKFWFKKKHIRTDQQATDQALEIPEDWNIYILNRTGFVGESIF